MAKIVDFVKRLPFLEFHPAIVAGVVLVPVGLIAAHTYNLVNIDKMPEDMAQLIRENQKRLQTSYENAKRYDDIDKILRPNKYA